MSSKARGHYGLSTLVQSQGNWGPLPARGQGTGPFLAQQTSFWVSSSSSHTGCTGLGCAWSLVGLKLRHHSAVRRGQLPEQGRSPAEPRRGQQHLPPGFLHRLSRGSWRWRASDRSPRSLGLTRGGRGPPPPPAAHLPLPPHPILPRPPRSVFLGNFEHSSSSPRSRQPSHTNRPGQVTTRSAGRATQRQDQSTHVLPPQTLGASPRGPRVTQPVTQLCDHQWVTVPLGLTVHQLLRECTTAPCRMGETVCAVGLWAPAVPHPVPGPAAGARTASLLMWSLCRDVRDLSGVGVCPRPQGLHSQ